MPLSWTPENCIIFSYIGAILNLFSAVNPSVSQSQLFQARNESITHTDREDGLPGKALTRPSAAIADNRLARASSQTKFQPFFRASVLVLTLLSMLPAVLAGWAQTAPGTVVPARLSSQAYQQLTPSEVVRFNWGSGERQVGLLKIPGGNFGPQSFAVDETLKRFYILDSTNSRILIFNLGGGLSSSLAISDRADDLTLGADGEIYVLYRGARKVIEYSPDGSSIASYSLADSQTPVTGIHSNGTRDLSVETADGHSYPVIDQGAEVDNRLRGGETIKGLRRNEKFYYLERSNAGRGSITVLDSGGQIQKQLAVNNKEQGIETLSLVGVDNEKNVYIAQEEASDSATLPVKRYIRKFDSQGNLLAEALIPYSSYVYTFKDLRVTGDGNVYQLLPLKDHVEILAWKMNVNGSQPAEELVSWIFSYTTPKSQDFLPGDSPLAGAKQLLERTQIASAVQPETTIAVSSVMSVAESFRTHTFNVAASNIANGVNCGGKTIITPETTPGLYEGVPYKWGGFTGLAGVSSYTDDGNFFDADLAAGSYAGDIDTAVDFGSSCAAGVDCSGFVSQVWGLNTKQSTGTLPGISCCLDSSCTYPSAPTYPYYISAGDILNSDSSNGGVGHVRLVSLRNADGSFTVYEASARTWNVSTYSYSISALSSNYYYPYRGEEVANALQTGSSIQTSTAVNVRSCASTSCDPPICSAPAGSTGTLLGQPQDAGGYIWWQVSWNNGTGTCPSGTTGWSVGCFLQLPAPPTVAVTPVPATITSLQSLAVTVSVAGGSGLATPSGNVTLTSGTYSAQQMLISGTASFTIPAGTLPSGSNTLTASYPGDTTYPSSSGTSTVTVSQFAIAIPAPSAVSPGTSATAIATIAAGSTYSGTINLTCTLTSSPAGAQSLPTCSLNPASVSISSGGNKTTTLTVNTTSAASSARMRPLGPSPWRPVGGGAVLAVVLIFGFPARRRRWMSMLVLLCVIVAAGAIGCSGGGSSTPVTPSTPATTAGSYTFTVSGTDSANSSIKSSATVVITVL